MKKIGFIGCGNMASAFINGITSRGNVSFSDILIYTRTKDKAERFLNKGAIWCSSSNMLAQTADILFICVKPQQADEVLREISSCVKQDAILVTMLAGKKIGYFKSHLGADRKIIRIMPNTPLLLGCGAVAMSVCAEVSENDINAVNSLISLLGIVRIIPEEQMDAIVAVNGSSPAYFYLFVKCIADWAGENGVDYGTALDLAVQSMLGSAKMLRSSGKTPDELIKEVSSPGGTTLAALSSFEQDSFKDIVCRALDACKNRSDELSSM